MTARPLTRTAAPFAATTAQRTFQAGKRYVVPLGVTAAAILGSLFSEPAVRDAATLSHVPGARLDVSPQFVLLSPLYNTWDTVTLLPASQHVALLLATLAGYLLWRVRATRSNKNGIRWRHELAGARAALTFFLAWYALGALAPRPMASLVVADPDGIVVDFHSHTDVSHDGRRGFSAERNREWHRSAGFDVAYVSDHGTYAAVREAVSRNPARAGDGTVLLPAYETRHDGEHLIVLGFSAAVAHGFTPPASLASHPVSTPPAVITLPAKLENDVQGVAIVGVEVIDGSPRGLEFGARRRADLLRLASRLGAAPVFGSNNHGWGRTAPGWTVLKIRGWRDLSAASLDEAILATLRSGDASRVVVIERASPIARGKGIKFANHSAFVRNPMATLTLPEQLAWISWAWFAWWIVQVTRRRHDRGRLNRSV